MHDKQITFAPHGHILTNTAVWSPDSRRIVYDIRSDAEGSLFDGTRIETVDVASGEVHSVYQSRNAACCGVATFHPRAERVVFISGPEHPDAGWSYGAARRQGVMVDMHGSDEASPLDARDLTSPFTPGALRGGSHVHVYAPDGARVSFTYEDHILSRFVEPGPDHDINQRNVGVTVVGVPVKTSRDHPRNHDGSGFTVLVTRTTAQPARGSDQYRRAYEEGWIGAEGYRRGDGSRQRYALAFLGDVVADDGSVHAEVFVADLPEDLTRPGEGPLAGTETRLPWPPAGVVLRRLTRTAQRRHRGVTGVRHWVRSSPDGSQLAFLMTDHAGISQIWTISPIGGEPRQLTSNPFAIASAFSWSPDGNRIAHVMDGDVCVTSVHDGRTRRLSNPVGDRADVPLPLACVFSPDGRRIAYQRRVKHGNDARYNQIFVLTPH